MPNLIRRKNKQQNHSPTYFGQTKSSLHYPFGSSICNIWRRLVDVSEPRCQMPPRHEVMTFETLKSTFLSFKVSDSVNGIR